MIKKYKEFVDEGLLRHYNRWHNGEKRQEDKHEYVDLGLPSGLLWAKCNIGADTEVDVGDYYAWGETKVKDEYSWKNYELSIGTSPDITKYNEKDKLRELELVDDVAHVNWGGKWRMPTKEEFEELIDNTYGEYVEDYNDSGVNGILFTSDNNDNTIFFPASGYMYLGNISKSSVYIWTSSIDEMESEIDCAINIVGSDDDDIFVDDMTREAGIPVRGVMKK